MLHFRTQHFSGARTYLWVFALALLLSSCDKGELLDNLPPDSHISIEAIELNGEQRLNSTIRLSWFGTDQDGYVTGFEFSLDGLIWIPTQTQDTTFLFQLNADSDTTDIDFYLRAIDNEGAKDPNPAYLKIPLKNTPPVIEAVESKLPADTVLGVYTFQWQANDADGNNTLTKVWMKVNNGSWYPLNLNQRLISLMATDPQRQGPTEAWVYANTENNPLPQKIDGFINGGDNVLFLKAGDIAGAESMVDTVEVRYVREINADLLVIGTLPPEVSQEYLSLLNAAYPSGFDYLDYNKNNGAEMPKFWNPSFRLLLDAYPKLFVFSDQSRMVNPQTSQSGLFPEFISQSIQQYTDGGGKYFMSMSFPTSADLTNIRGPFPIDSISSSRGQAVLSNDSLVLPALSGYPVLQSSNLILGTDPFVPSINAEVFYTARLTPFSGWSGPRTVASRRLSNGKVSQVFFSLELHLLNKNRNALISLLDTVLNNDFKD